MKTKDPEGQTARWIESLALFDFEIQHRPGKRHNNADAFSRIPIRKEKTKRTAASRKEQQSQEPPLLKEAQLADPEIKLVREWVEKEERPPWTDIRSLFQKV